MLMGEVDMLAGGPWLWTDEQRRLILSVHGIEVVCRLGNAWRALEIIEGEGRRVTVECTVDVREGCRRVNRQIGKKRARQTLETVEIDGLIAGAACNTADPWPRGDRKLFGPTSSAVPPP